MKNTGIIIQARTGSKRFPNKVLSKIGDKNLIEHVIFQIKKTKFKKKIIISTSNKVADRSIFEIAKFNNCLTFRGSERNVLKRFFYTATKFKLGTIIRISADSPFIDPKIIENAYEIFRSKNFDYVSNIINPSYPKGMSVEIFNYDCLKKTFENATSASNKEHVTEYMYKKNNFFKIKNFKLKKSLRIFNFSVNTKKELKFLKLVYDNLKKDKIEKNFNLKDLISSAIKLKN